VVPDSEGGIIQLLEKVVVWDIFALQPFEHHRFKSLFFLLLCTVRRKLTPILLFFADRTLPQ
jgi:hypothetical protein